MLPISVRMYQTTTIEFYKRTACIPNTRRVLFCGLHFLQSGTVVDGLAVFIFEASETLRRRINDNKLAFGKPSLFLRIPAGNHSFFVAEAHAIGIHARRL